MATWFTSDTHYGHKNIIEYCNRPYESVEQMNEAMIDAHNSCVKPEDTVYFLGDFAFGDFQRVVERLQGKKILVLGNHDQKIISKKSDWIGQNRFSQIHDYKEIKVGGQKICLFHFGMRVWNGSHKGTWHLYGHSHGTLPPQGLSVDVGVDSPYVTGTAPLRPLSFDEIAHFMSGRTVELVDHHNERTNT